MSLFLKTISIVCFVIVAATLVRLAGAVVVSLRHTDHRLSKGQLAALFLALAAFSVLLLRPHEYTFQGLDASGYRLMAKALAQGRPLKGVDQPLLTVPREVRSALLYRPLDTFRKTRDQSFQIESLDTCRTKLFYYPLLPLCMIGFDAMVPGDVQDFFVPLVGLFFIFLLLAVGFDRAGSLGLLASGALLLVTALPAWFLRGSYPESVGGVLFALALLAWAVRETEQGSPPLAAYLALGLAISFHPVFVVFSVPMAGIMLLSTVGPRRKLASKIAALLAGLAPLAIMTLTVAAPYGEMKWSIFRTIVRRSPAIRVTVVAGVIGALLLIGALLIQPLVRRRFPLRGRFWRCAWVVTVAAAWVVPTVLALYFWREGPAVARGLYEMREALRVAGLTLVAVAAVTLLFSKRLGSFRIASLPVFAVLPVFFYLKGWDHAGLWSQRRLLPVALTGLTLLVPALSDAVGFLTSGARWRKSRLLVVSLGLLTAGLVNGVRWPAPYWVRFDHGADHWVKGLAEQFRSGLFLFDYHGHSIPFAVSGEGRVFGVGRHGFEKMPVLAPWLAERAGQEDVYWLSAYANPGVEEGVVLEEVSRQTVRLPRVRCNTVFPAVRDSQTVDFAFLRVRPVTSTVPASLNKVFDGGNLALRGPWGRSDVSIRLDDGTRLPARWSREGSAVVGPVPAPGSAVRIDIGAAACRRDAVSEQVLRIQPPWPGPAVSLVISNDYTWVSAVCERPSFGTETEAAPRAGTGWYTLTSERPYNPRTVGIRGFDRDLGALIHEIRITPLPVSDLASPR